MNVFSRDKNSANEVLTWLLSIEKPLTLKHNMFFLMESQLLQGHTKKIEKLIYVWF